MNQYREWEKTSKVSLDLYPNLKREVESEVQKLGNEMFFE